MYKELRDYINNKKTVFVFDIDGVLAKYEYGDDLSHAFCSESYWPKITDTNIDIYKKARAVPTFKRLIKPRTNNVFVCSREVNPLFMEMKRKFVIDNYNINPDNIFFVKTDKDKLDIMYKIYTMDKYYYDLTENDICIIDDSTSVLDYVYDNSRFTTIHVSSFLK